MDGSIRVLVVDDDPALAALVAEYVPREDERLVVETATSARVGLDRLDGDDVDCIVSDYDMPETNGLAFLEMVREARPDLPFILFTGKGSEEVASDAISAGVTDYLQKQTSTDQYTLLANRITNAVERARAEQARDRHLAAIESAHEGISILDDGRFVYVNGTYADLYGYDPDEMLGAHWELIYPDDEVEMAREEILPAVEREHYWHGETTGLRADGSTFTEDHTLATTGHGELICIVSDLSDDRAQASELHRLRERFRRFASAVPNGFFLVSPDFSETQFVNDGLEGVFGVTTEEMTARPESWTRHVDPADRTELERTLRRHRDGPTAWPVERTLRVHHPDRGRRRVHLRVSPVRDQAGDVVELAGVATDVTERERQAQAVTETNTVLKTIVEHLPMGVLVEDADREIIVANDTLGETLGVPLEGDDFVGRDCATAAEESKHLFADPEAFLSVVEETVERRTRFRNEELHLADGRVLELDYVPYTLPDGDAHLWLYRDVTARKERAAALETRTAAMDAAMDGISILDDDGHYVYMNESHAAVFGYRPEELVGGSWRRLYGAAERARLEAEVLPRLEQAGEWRGETVGRTKSGEVVYVEISLSLLEEGGFTCTNHDVTERKERELELAAARERYKSLFENNPLAVWEEDFSETRAALDELRAEVDSVEAYLLDHPAELHRILDTIEVIDVNRNAVEYYGAASKADLVENLDRLFTDRAYEVAAAELAAVAEGATRFRGDTVYRRIDGERHDEMLDLYVPDAAADDYSRVFVTGTDITDRKQKERELLRERDRLDEFASFVSHDLRNPLSVAAGNLELLREECESDRLAAIDRALDRMDQLITDLLTLAREGETVGEVSPVSLDRLVSDCWRNVETGDARLDVEGAPTVLADRERVTTLLENLLRNAVEHGSTSPRSQAHEDAVEHGSTSPRSQAHEDAVEHGSTGRRATPDDAVEQGRRDVRVTLGALPDGEGFYVADDGPGIPPEKRDWVFESGHSTNRAGTGFGLAIVQQIAEAHGWDITTTESAAGGARFEVRGVETETVPTTTGANEGDD
jgi:PAS domain S-box-containing protein